MNTDTGQIVLPEELRKMFGPNVTVEQMYAKRFKPMAIDPTPEQQARGYVGRNDPCPCGSGLKFKRCCCTSKGRPSNG